MFIRKYLNFKKDIEKAIDSFFKMSPENLEFCINEFHERYDGMYNLDEIPIKNVAPEHRDSVMLYKTMKYFYMIYQKMLELEKAICNEEGI